MSELECQDNVNKQFAEAVYQEMASIRYGIEFCCSPDLKKWSIKKELIDLSALQVDICPDSENPAQPLNRNFVPGVCGVINVVIGEDIVGAEITYVSCDSYLTVTKEYTVAGTDRICYDTGAGYTISNTNCPTCVTVTESAEACVQPINCLIYTATGPKSDDASLTYLTCAGEEVSVMLDLNNPLPPTCMQEDSYTAIGGVVVQVTNEPCQ